MYRIALGLGSNLGCRGANIQRAVRSVLVHAGATLVASSRLYETLPCYVEDQPKFLNGACLIDTNTHPIDLLTTLKQVEKDMGRMKTIRNGPRCIDLDILSCQDTMNGEVLALNLPDLAVPHPRMREREFVMKPYQDLFTNVHRHPGSRHHVHHNDTNGSSSSSCVAVLPTQIDHETEVVFALDDAPARVMGVVNCTPDSFSDVGKCGDDVDAAMTHVEALVDAGVDIVDIGGESTRPQAVPVSAEEELRRVLPVIEAIRAHGDARVRNVVISIDTYKSVVAREAVAHGANWVNDVGVYANGEDHKDMLAAVCDLDVPYVLMHSRGNPNTMLDSCSTDYSAYNDDVIEGVCAELDQRIGACMHEHSLFRWNLILDPGFGFAKNTEQNISLLQNLAHFVDKASPFPSLVGLSKKRFIGTLADNDASTSARLWGTAAAITHTVMQGAHFVRVHDPDMVHVVRAASNIRSHDAI